MIDHTLYRVSLLCECNADLTYGYGATAEEARATAMAYWRKHHKGQRIKEEIVERAVEHAGGGSHYEEETEQ